MKREVNNSRQCIECGVPVPRKVKRCPPCNSAFRKRRPPYIRTPEHRARMSAAQKGKRHTWNTGSMRPEVVAKIRAWWTPERREARRQQVLQRNPNARYHGLSARGAARIRAEVGQCQQCGTSEGRLDIHHKDGDKRNQEPENLGVLCRRCHMNVHAERGETGWHSYHRKRKMSL